MTPPLGRSERWAEFSDDEIAVLMLALQAFAASDDGFNRAREEMLTEATRALQLRIGRHLPAQRLGRGR